MEIVEPMHPCALCRGASAADAWVPRKGAKVQLHLILVVACVVDNVHRASKMLVAHVRQVGDWGGAEPHAQRKDEVRVLVEDMKVILELPVQ